MFRDSLLFEDSCQMKHPAALLSLGHLMPEIPERHRRIFPSGTRCFRTLLNGKPERFLEFHELQFKSLILSSEELNLPHLT
jgi:hypothetical protein